MLVSGCFVTKETHVSHIIPKFIDCNFRIFSLYIWWQFTIFTLPIIHLVYPLPLKNILHNQCFQFLLHITVIPRETQDKLTCMQDFGIMGNVKMVKRKKHQLPTLLTSHLKFRFCKSAIFEVLHRCQGKIRQF